MSNASTYQVPKETFSVIKGTPKTFTKLSDFERVLPM